MNRTIVDHERRVQYDSLVFEHWPQSKLFVHFSPKTCAILGVFGGSQSKFFLLSAAFLTSIGSSDILCPGTKRESVESFGPQWVLYLPTTLPTPSNFIAVDFSWDNQLLLIHYISCLHSYTNLSSFSPSLSFSLLPLVIARPWARHNKLIINYGSKMFNLVPLSCTKAIYWRRKE